MNKNKFPKEFPFWARLKISKNRTTLIIDEEIVINKKSKKEYVLIAVRQNGLSLDCADHKFRDDEDVVYAAVSNCGWAINLTSPRLSKNPKIINKFSIF